jgi:hypothetical protein
LIRKIPDEAQVLFLEMMQAYSGALYPVDMLMSASINRSMALSRGFADLLESRNYISAVPLLRMQLDSALRTSAILLAENPHDLAIDVLKGAQMNQLKGRGNVKLSDKYLADNLTKKYPWVALVYQRSSGFVHLSQVHFSMKTAEDGSYEIGVSHTPEFAEELYLEIAEAYLACWNLLIEFINAWKRIKDNPTIIKT